MGGDSGEREGVSTSERERLKALEREAKELRGANEIPNLANAFFAQAELDRSPGVHASMRVSVKTSRRDRRCVMRTRIHRQGKPMAVVSAKEASRRRATQAPCAAASIDGKRAGDSRARQAACDGVLSVGGRTVAAYPPLSARPAAPLSCGLRRGRDAEGDCVDNSAACAASAASASACAVAACSMMPPPRHTSPS